MIFCSVIKVKFYSISIVQYIDFMFTQLVDVLVVHVDRGIIPSMASPEVSEHFSKLRYQSLNVSIEMRVILDWLSYVVQQKFEVF